MERQVLHRQYRRTTILLIACCSVLAGLLLARTKLPMSGWCVVFAAIVTLATVRRRDASTVLAIILFGIVLGWWRGSAVFGQLQIYHQLSDQKVSITGTAISDAVYAENSQLEFIINDIHLSSPVNKSIPGKIKVRGFGARMVFRGDQVHVSGKLYPTRGANQADIYYAQIDLWGRNPTLIDSFRRKFTAGMQSALPEPAASFGLGLLIGQRNTLPADVSQTLLMVGLVHIIAVSGYNLTILLEAARRLLGKRSKFQTMAVALALIGAFLLVAGGSASIVRAAVISIIGLAAWYYGRSVKPLLLIFLAAAITSLANPVYLWSSISWYLSFLAFFGILVLAPQLIKRFFKKRPPGMLAQIAIESLCAELMTMPIVLFTFGQISFIGLVANLLVAALIPLAMLLSLVAGLAGMLVPAIAGWFAWPATVLLTYMLDVARLLSRIPHIFVQNLSLSVVGMATLYAAVMVWLVVLWRKNHQTDKITDVATALQFTEAKQSLPSKTA